MRYFFLITLIIKAFSCYTLEVSSLSCLEILQPGESKQIQISLRNEKTDPQLVNFRIVDYWCNSEGEHFYEESINQPRSNASWVILSSARELLAPCERKNLFLTIQAPPQVPQEGSYWSVLLIEPGDPVQTVKPASEGLQLEIKIRYAFHIVTNVGSGSPKLKILKKEMKTINGEPYLCVDVLNNGNLFLNPKLSVKLFDMRGKLAATLSSAAERLYPQSSQRFFLKGDQLEKKKFKGFFLFDNGDNQLFGDQLELDFS